MDVDSHADSHFLVILGEANSVRQSPAEPRQDVPQAEGRVDLEPIEMLYYFTYTPQTPNLEER